MMSSRFPYGRLANGLPVLRPRSQAQAKCFMIFMSLLAYCGSVA